MDRGKIIDRALQFLALFTVMACFGPWLLILAIPSLTCKAIGWWRARRSARAAADFAMFCKSRGYDLDNPPVGEFKKYLALEREFLWDRSRL